MGQIHPWAQRGFAIGFSGNRPALLQAEPGWWVRGSGTGVVRCGGSLKMRPALDPAHPLSTARTDGQWELGKRVSKGHGCKCK